MKRIHTTCTVPNCSRPHRCKGYCQMHYTRLRAHGDPMKTKISFEMHGMSTTSEHCIWRSMKNRCHSPGDKGYRLYGGRGIQVCERWRNSFSAFYADMGPRPTAKHSIDRINNERNYEPGNCRWATREEQGNNTRVNVRLLFQGESLTVPQWARRLGINEDTITWRLRRGWTVEKALTTPLLTQKDRANRELLQSLRS